MKKLLPFAVAFSTIGIPAANAVNGTVIFNGTILATCLITIGTPGTLVASADFTELSSQNGGGLSGTATVVTTGLGYSLSTSAPASFTSAPADGDANVTFSSSYSASGVTSLLDVVGSVTSPLGLGITNVEVDLAATKSAGIFPAGSYTAEVTVTCE